MKIQTYNETYGMFSEKNQIKLNIALSSHRKRMIF